MQGTAGQVPVTHEVGFSGIGVWLDHVMIRTRESNTRKSLDVGL
jgi:hypothetical protein